MSFGLPCITVRDLYNNVHYRIEGPAVCACRYAKEAYFKVFKKINSVFKFLNRFHFLGL